MSDQYQTRASVRLIFEYDESGVRLVAEQPIEMATSTPQSPARLEEGYYLETRAADDSMLHRARVEHAFSRSMEVFPEDPLGGIERVDTPPGKGAFMVVVPASEAADHISLINVQEAVEPASADAPVARTAPRSVEVARFRLTQRR
jgi:hypothetical protein